MTAIDRDRWRELEPLLDRALELPDEARAAWLGALRSQSPELAAELASLLSGETVADRRGFLAEPLAAGRAAPTLAGLELGAYTLERPLGHGGMGTVWLARRSDGRFEATAAVKLLNLALLSPAGRERFRREGSVLARLTHPGIARLLDAGVSPAGQPYLVLEYVEGERIDRYCEERGLPVHDRLWLFLQVLSAVAQAHASLIVHRDLKPTNIMVTADGTAKLLDFGLAKLVEPDAAPELSSPGAPSSEPPVTYTARGWMTPEYAAPEQIRSEPITTRTDVYQLGAVLYELLAGRRPFVAPTPHDLESAVLHDEPAPPSTVVRRAAEGSPTPNEGADAGGGGAADTAPRGDRGVPSGALRGDLDAIVLKAMRKAPEERYASVHDFADDVRRHLSGHPVLARRQTAGYRVRRYVRRHGVQLVAGMITVAGLLGATVVSIDEMREARRQRDLAVVEKKRADAQVEFQYLMLTNIGTGRVTTREIVDQGTELLEREYGGEPAVAASIALSLADRYSELGDLDRQAQMLSRAESLAVAGGATDVLLLSRCSRALNLQKRQRAAEAAALVGRIRPQLAAAAAEDAAGCLSALAEYEIKAGRFDSAAALGLRSARMMDSLGQTKGLEYINVLNTAANALENAKRRREALAIYRRIAAALDSTGRNKSIVRNVIRNNIGIALSNLGEMTAAEPILHETLEEFRRSNPAGDVHPAILINYCRTALFLRHLDSAGTWYARLYTQSAARNDTVMQEEGGFGMAEVELARGRLAEAARWIAEEKPLSARLPIPRPANGLYLEAELAHARGDPRAAGETFRRALRTMGYFDGKRTYQLRGVLIRAAEAALDAGTPGEALEYARAAHGIATSDPLTEEHSAYVGEARLLEGRALLATGDTAGSRAALVRAVAALRAGAGADHPRTREAQDVLARLTR